MPSETDLINDALAQIGATPVADINEGVPNANYCLRFYPALRDGMLRMHHWNFALKRVILSIDVENPAKVFAFRYALPNDYIKIVEYRGAPVELVNALYRVEGDFLLCNDNPISILYISRVTDPNLFDSLFYQALTTWLASKLALAIAKDSQKSADLLTQALQVLMPMAMSTDGQEGTELPQEVPHLYYGR